MNHQAVFDVFCSVDQEGRIISVGEKALRLLDASNARALLGRPLAELFRHSDEDKIHSALETPGEAILSSVISSGKRVEVCVSVSPPAETGRRSVFLRPLESTCPLRRTISSVEQDQERLLGELQVGVMVCGPASEALRWNPKALELLGMTEGQLTGRTAYDSRWTFLRADGTEFHREDMPGPVAARTKKPVRSVLMGVYRPARQDRVWLMVDAEPRLDTNGDLIDVVVTFTDVTKQQRMSDNFARAQKFELVSRMAGSIAHDFNNVLAVITSLSEARMFEDISEKERSFLRHVVDSTHRGSQLTRKLLNLSGGLLEQPRDLAIDDHLRDLLPLLQRAAGEQIDLRMELDAPLARATLDPSRLEQAILNLTINARDAMAEGGPLVIRTYATERPAEAPTLAIEVRDSGTGIHPEVADRIFEPFFTTKTEDQGTGLGLSSVQEFVSSSEGRVEFESSEEGAIFRLLLPCRIAESPRAAERPEPSVPVKSPRRGKRLLVVDNDAEVRGATGNLLHQAGYDVMLAESGHAAIEILEMNAIDLLVTDVLMPAMGGRALAAIARETNPGLPVLFMSGFTGTQAENIPSSSQRERFVAKPFSAAELLRSIDELLGSEKTASLAGSVVIADKNLAAS